MWTVAAFYHFARLDDLDTHRTKLLGLCREAEIMGTILLAPEGVNGTVAGSRGSIDRLIVELRRIPGCEGLSYKESRAAEMPFGRMKVRLKREIVTMGQPDVDPMAAVGTYVTPKDWNAVLEDPDTVIIDTRNSYEVAIGTFDGAIDPKTESFGDFPAWWQENAARFEGKRIAMFCTGGIRCEKSTSYLIGQGVNDVCHLQGGILKYLEEVPNEESRWQGACFVFDDRVSVEHGLQEGPHTLCHACRRPLLPADRGRSDFEEGVSCHHCSGLTSDSDKERFRMRQRQIALGRQRGMAHLGAKPVAQATQTDNPAGGTLDDHNISHKMR
ncbi:MAG: rhodanese-related sulfurtransferase [Pseudomonadota bacterium]